MRRYEEPVRVRADAEGVPLAFVWRGRRYAVRAVHARWHERRAWWHDALDDGASSPERDTEQHVFHVEAASRGLLGLFDLGADGPAGPWRLVRSHD